MRIRSTMKMLGAWQWLGEHVFALSHRLWVMISWSWWCHMFRYRIGQIYNSGKVTIFTAKVLQRISARKLYTILTLNVTEIIVLWGLFGFPQNNIFKNTTPEDWRLREGATFAFGSILEGPSAEQLTQFVSMGLSFLLSATKDPDPRVRNTTAWTVGRLIGFLCDALKLNMKCLSIKPHVQRRDWLHPAGSDADSIFLQVLLLGEAHFWMRRISIFQTLTYFMCSGRIFQFVHGPDSAQTLITNQNLSQITQVLLESLQDEPHIANRVKSTLF